MTAREALNAHYAAELGELFTTAGLCLYRDGRDSVAWHGDTIGRGKTEDTMVAIISLGSPRQFLLRPARWRRNDQARAGSRRSDRDGRLLPAHLGARDPEDRATGGSADQRAVPAERRTVAHARGRARGRDQADARGSTLDQARKSSKALLISSPCVHSMPCGAPSISR